MGKTTKVLLVIGASLILIGCVLFAGVMSMLKWDFAKLSTTKYETNTYTIDRAFSGITVYADTADIAFVLSDDGVCKVECYEEKKVKYAVTVEEDTLVVKVVDNRSWYDHIGINIGSPKLTVYLPERAYAALSVKGSTGNVTIPKDFVFGSVDISLSTGDISVDHISTDSLELSVTTGKVTVTGVECAGDITVGVSTGKMYLADIACKNLTTRGSTGNVSLDNVVAAERITIRRSTGDVKLDGCDAAELFVETNTGDVTGSLLTDKVFAAHTDTGRVNIPETGSGGRCEIATNTGNINITVQKD